jgi:hypothetical protein
VIWMATRVGTRGNLRQLVSATLVLCFVLLGSVSAQAFWPFGSGGSEGGSGLDLTQGYDVNTVTSIKGKVVSLNTDEGGGPVLIEIKTLSGAVLLVAGPRWYWKDNGIPVKVGDEIMANGAKAEGKDGRMYLLAQKLTNQNTGDSLILRGDDGVAVWSWMKRSPGQGRPGGGAQIPRNGPRPGGGQGLQRGK